MPLRPKIQAGQSCRPLFIQVVVLDLSVTHAAFLVAEKFGNASYGATLGWFHTGEEAEVETQDLVDILDVDGDGEPEIITQFGYYEAVEYHVYRKTKGKWVDFYKQFGAGC